METKAKINFEYHNDIDLLYISNNLDNLEHIGNLVMGNLVIDIAKNGKIIGIEISNASKIFSLKIEQLKNLNQARI